MKTIIPLLIAGIFSSIASGLFLFFYYRLIKTGNKTTGTVVSFDRSDFSLFQGILVPVVRFKTQDDSWVESQPEYSFLHGINGFVRHGNVTVYYQEDNPEKFVIESKTEVFLNWMIIALTLIGIIWLFIR